MYGIFLIAITLRYYSIRNDISNRANIALFLYAYSNSS